MMVFYYFWDYAIILPAAFFCILPVLQHSKIKPRLLLPLTSAALLITAAALAALRSLFAPDPNILLLGALVPMLLLYLLLFDVQKCRLGYIFLCGIAVFSFGGTATHYVQAVLNTEHEYLIACAIKWAISLLFLLAEVLSLKKLRWTINNENISSVWKYIWVVPLIITAANFFLIPSDYANVLVGRAFPLYVMFETVLVLFFIIFIIMKYVIARAITNKAEAEQNAQLLGMQAAQYEKLKKYLDNTAQMRHDFFYMAKTAQALAANNETEELKRLLSDYGAQIDSESSPRKYCENTALNAITAYYAEEAERQHIAFTARLNVAQSIMISDYELCSIVGNILDNAQPFFLHQARRSRHRTGIRQGNRQEEQRLLQLPLRRQHLLLRNHAQTKRTVTMRRIILRQTNRDTDAVSLRYFKSLSFSSPQRAEHKTP